MTEFKAENFLKTYRRTVQNSEVTSALLNRVSWEKADAYDIEKQRVINDKSLNVKQRSAKKRKCEKGKHELFVKECLAPRGYLDGDNEVFAFIGESFNHRDDGPDYDYTEYHISLLTPRMAYTDYKYFIEHRDTNGNKPWWYEEYRPYYYEIWLNIPNNDQKWKNFYEIQREKGWFLTSISSDADDDMHRRGILHFGGSETFSEEVSMSIKLIEQQKKDDALSYSEKVKLLAKLKTLYIYGIKKVSHIDLKTYLDSVIKTVNGYTVKILNMGEANCIHIKGDNDFSFLFDVGVPFEKLGDSKSVRDNIDYQHIDARRKGIKSSIGDLSRYKPDFTIITHWHSDHVKGFVHMCNDGLNCQWIVPEITAEVKDISCMRLVLYAASINRLCLVKDYGHKIYDNLTKGIELFRGEKSTDLNAISIILKLRDSLLPGDALYRHWPDDLKKQLDKINTLVVPHHGSKIESADITSMNNFNSSNKIAYISFGENIFFHPNKNHIDELKKHGFNDISATGGNTEDPYNGVSGGNIVIKNDSIEYTC